MKKFVALLVFLLTNYYAKAQVETAFQPLSIGMTTQIHSTLLNE